MGNIERLRVALTGFVGGPGVMTFYFVDAETAQSPLSALLDDLKPGMPAQMSMLVASSGDIIDDTNGDLVGAWTGTTQTPKVGADTSTYPAPAGACIRWDTDTVVDKHRVQGRTYLVPLGGGSYQNDGSINGTNVTNITNAATTFLALVDSNLKVWHRPRKAKAADGSKPAITARVGSSVFVTSAHCVDRTMVLRSRRQ